MCVENSVIFYPPIFLDFSLALDAILNILEINCGILVRMDIFKVTPFGIK